MRKTKKHEHSYYEEMKRNILPERTYWESGEKEASKKTLPLPGGAKPWKKNQKKSITQ